MWLERENCPARSFRKRHQNPTYPVKASWEKSVQELGNVFLSSQVLRYVQTPLRFELDILTINTTLCRSIFSGVVLTLSGVKFFPSSDFCDSVSPSQPPRNRGKKAE